MGPNPLSYVKRRSAERQAAYLRRIVGPDWTVTIGAKINGRHPLLLTRTPK